MADGKVYDDHHEVKMDDNPALMTQFIEDFDTEINKIQFEGTPIALVQKKIEKKVENKIAETPKAEIPMAYNSQNWYDRDFQDGISDQKLAQSSQLEKEDWCSRGILSPE